MKAKTKTAVAETAALVTVDASAVEVMTGNPLFDRARQILAEVKTSFLSLKEYKEALGRELLEVKTRLGFDIVGRKKGSQDAGDPKLPHGAGVSNPRTWPEWTRVELGISDDTADRAIAYFQAFQMLREAIGDDSPVFHAGRVPFESLKPAEIKIIREAVNKFEEGKYKNVLLKAFDIKSPPHILTGGDTTAWRKLFTDPTPDQAANCLQAAFAVFFKATKELRRHFTRTDIELWLTVVPFVASDPAREMGLMDYQYQMEKLISDAIADLDGISARISRFVKARQEGANHPPKRIRKPKQPANKQ